MKPALVVGLVIATAAQAQQITCPTANKPAVCAALVPGTPLPYVNSAAPKLLDLSKSNSYELVIIGHSENRGYHTPLKTLIANNPSLVGVKVFVQAAVDDPAAGLGLALTQGLELVVGK